MRRAKPGITENSILSGDSYSNYVIDSGLLTAMVIPWVLLVALCSANVAYIAYRCYNLKLKRGAIQN